jgi:D-glycero-alpha-D-manno-heptose-7-phosphate kinase
MIVQAWAPNRILDFGGWTDTWFAGKGAVLNFAVDLYAKVVVMTRVKPGVSITAYDYGEVIEVLAPEAATYDGKHDLLKAAVKVMGIDRIDAYVYSDVPPGCGTGSSAAVSVALLGALSMLTPDRFYRPDEVARLAHELETKELGIESGVQDQLAAVVGGISYHTIDPYPRCSSAAIRLREETVWELESRLLLVYTGQRHLSSDVHRKVIAEYQAGKPETVRAMETLRQTPQKAAAALWQGDFEAFAEVMNENNHAQKQLHEDIVTPSVLEIEGATMKVGAIGFKINGAGGGGSVAILCDVGRRRDVEDEVRRLGYRLLAFRFDFVGLRRWISAR